MEPEGSLPYSQEPTIGPYPEPVHTTPSLQEEIKTRYK
jgi:hypothetical protein